MAKNRKIPAIVRQQASTARAQEEPETGVSIISARNALAQARLAGRELRRLGRDRLVTPPAQGGPSPVSPHRPTIRMKPHVEHRLTVNGLVTLSRSLVGIRIEGVDNLYVALQKGDVGVLIARDIWGRGGSGGRREYCHVMLPVGIVEIPASVVRDCAGSDED